MKRHLIFALIIIIAMLIAAGVSLLAKRDRAPEPVLSASPAADCFHKQRP